LETSGVPFFDAKGNVSGFRGIDRDVTERKRAEEEAQESFRKLQRTVEGTIQAIALTVETRDPYTAGHQRRVTKLAYAIAREMRLSNDKIQRVRIASLLHDLGKIFVPTEILSKPGQLTDVEFSIIKSHPQAGHEILKNIEFPWPIADIVIQHHERMNGSGYPAGLKEEEIVMEARILAVADVVEAMSSHRPYRPALGLDKALKEIVNNKGVFYDANVVEACMRVFNGGVFKFDD
jgi:putative nucleotidyltransferase with HDIG domain